MTHTKQLVREIVAFQKANVLRSVSSREKFSKDLCEVLNFWSLSLMSSFVDEMHGLNFSNQSDREIFIQFFFNWFLDRDHLEDAP